MKTAFLFAGLILAAGACKKGGGGGGGGGGGWLVGTSGLMVNVQTNGTTSGYELDSAETLNAIACRYAGEAWVVGTSGTLLYTSDGGASWRQQAVPTTADLRALATQDAGPVYVAGNGVFLTSSDTGATWASLGDGTTNFRSLAAAQEADTVLAVADDGTLWSYENSALVARGNFRGARAVAVSADGQTAVLAGDDLLARSVDAGRTWTVLPGSEVVRYDSVRIEATGQAIAVGSGGAIAHIGADGNIVMQHLGTADLHTIHLAYADGEDEGRGFAAGAGGDVWLTRDGGWTWTKGPNVGQTVLGADIIGAGHN